LRYGRNAQLRRIAQEIIVEQQQEIIAMRIATGRPIPPAVAIADQQRPNSTAKGHAHMTHSIEGMTQ